MADDIQNNLDTFAASVGAAVKPLRYLPAKPAAGTYELSVNAQGAASWVAPAPAAAATPPHFDYAYLSRSNDQTNVRHQTPIVFNQQVNGDVDNPYGFSQSLPANPNNDLIFWPSGFVSFRANRTYLLRATLYLNIPNGFNGRIGWARYFPTNNPGSQYGPLHNGYGAHFWGTGGQNIQCIVTESVFRPDANIDIYFTITGASDGSTAMTVKGGSTAFVQRIA
jgi:hypothetical protein